MREVLVSREALEELIDTVDGLEPYRSPLAARWIGMVMWWHQQSTDARRKYFALRAIMIAGGTAIPVVTTVSAATGWRTAGTVAAAAVGAIVAAAAAWEGVANYGETWREKRRAAELLKVEGYQFIQLCGRYSCFGSAGNLSAGYPRAYLIFAAQMEAMIAQEVGEYLSKFDRPDKGTSEE